MSDFNIFLMVINVKYKIKSDKRAKPYNRESFLIKANEIYDSKYSYDQMVYLNQSTPIVIICPIHGEFMRTPSYHLQGGHCPECSKINMSENGKRIRSPEFFEKIKQTNIERYGQPCYLHSKEFLEKIKERDPDGEITKRKIRETNIAKYGAKTWAESEVGRAKLKECMTERKVGDKISHALKSIDVRLKYKATSIKNCDAEHWTKSKDGKQRLKSLFNTDEERMNRRLRMLNPAVKSKIQATSMARYGVPYYWQSANGKRRLKILLNSEAVIAKTKETNLARYGSEHWCSSEIGRKTLSDLSKTESVQNKRIQTRRKNGTINSSRPEKIMFISLCSVFGVDDVVAQYKDSDRYPYRCDFYIKSLDLFIELNAHWTHGGHWFNENNEDDLIKLQSWLCCYKKGYMKAITTWVKKDHEKRQCAIDNNLNYVVFWANDLSDFNEWLKKYL